MGREQGKNKEGRLERKTLQPKARTTLLSVMSERVIMSGSKTRVKTKLGENELRSMVQSVRYIRIGRKNQMNIFFELTIRNYNYSFISLLLVQFVSVSP